MERERELLEELGVPDEKRPRITGAEDKEPETASLGVKTDCGLNTGGRGPGAEVYQRAVR